VGPFAGALFARAPAAAPKGLVSHGENCADPGDTFFDTVAIVRPFDCLFYELEIVFVHRLPDTLAELD
jgi:hypothetical protein